MQRARILRNGMSTALVLIVAACSPPAKNDDHGQPGAGGGGRAATGGGGEQGGEARESDDKAAGGKGGADKGSGAKASGQKDGDDKGSDDKGGEDQGKDKESGQKGGGGQGDDKKSGQKDGDDKDGPKDPRAEKNYPQPVLVGVLTGRRLIAPEESQPVLGWIRGVVRTKAGETQLVVETAALAGLRTGGRLVTVDVDEAALLNRQVALTGGDPDDLSKAPAYRMGSLPAVDPRETIRMGVVKPFH